MSWSPGILVPLAGLLGLWPAWPRTVVVLSGTPFLVGPLLYGYVASQTGSRRFLTGRGLAVHLALPVAYGLVTFPILLKVRVASFTTEGHVIRIISRAGAGTQPPRCRSGRSRPPCRAAARQERARARRQSNLRSSALPGGGLCRTG